MAVHFHKTKLKSQNAKRLHLEYWCWDVGKINWQAQCSQKGDFCGLGEAMEGFRTPSWFRAKGRIRETQAKVNSNKSRAQIGKKK